MPAWTVAGLKSENVRHRGGTNYAVYGHIIIIEVSFFFCARGQSIILILVINVALYGKPFPSLQATLQA
jgi:hypothetical protein